MSQVLEKRNYDEEQYFNRKVANRYNYDQPVASPNYSESVQEDYREEKQNVSITKRKLTTFEMSWLCVCSIIAVIAISASFILRVDMIEQTTSIDNLEDSITEYSSTTDVLRSQITEQFNYNQIKDAANNNGMTIDKDRVRTVEK